jgi:hypothetical protein
VATAQTHKTLGSRITEILLSDYFVLYLSLAYVAVLAPFIPTLLAPQNFVNILSNT